MRVTKFGKSIERVLEEQTKEGLFPTYRSENIHDLTKPIIQEPTQQIDNIGIHAYILDKLIYLNKRNLKIELAFKHGLGVIVEKAVSYNGQYLWRWLKNPNEPDYLYPPDHDDTARAIATIEIARKHYPRLYNYFKGKYKETVERDYEKLLLDDLFWVDDKFKPILDSKRKERGVFTFIRKYGSKEHNEIDPVVNAHILYGYLLYLKNRRKGIQRDKIIYGISRFLSSLILSEHFDKDFQEISRFYLTPTLMSNVIADITLIEPEIFDRKVKERIISKMNSFLPNSPNVFETAKATEALLKLGHNGKEIKRGINQILDECEDGIWLAYPFYQHKRLNHIFGSKAATSVFCLEVIDRYKHSIGGLKW